MYLATFAFLSLSQMLLPCARQLSDREMREIGRLPHDSLTDASDEQTAASLNSLAKLTENPSE